MREYKKTHPWLAFELARHLDRERIELWLLLGQVSARCHRMSRVPMPPWLRDELHQVYLAKGVHATTAIEGNTLSVEQVRQEIRGELKVPESKAYLQREIQNVLARTNDLLEAARRRELATPSVAEILLHNARLLEALPHLAEEVIPGKFRQHRVTVASYRGAPPADCPELVANLCDWLRQEWFALDKVADAILKAIVAHVYLAWIHPFGDGNGRTARLVEVQILFSAGIPSPAAHILSNHYNESRAAYYQELDRTSKRQGALTDFVVYALRGLRDGLDDQFERITREQVKLIFDNTIDFAFDQERSTPAKMRQRRLAKALNAAGAPVAKWKVPALARELARDYSGSQKMLTRDLNALVALQLVREEAHHFIANTETLLPHVATVPEKQRIPGEEGG